jgi:hypothetical protein
MTPFYNSNVLVFAPFILFASPTIIEARLAQRERRKVLKEEKLKKIQAVIHIQSHCIQ